MDTKRFLMDKKVKLLAEYEYCLDRGLTFQAKNIRLKLELIDELISEVKIDG